MKIAKFVMSLIKKHKSQNNNKKYNTIIINKLVVNININDSDKNKTNNSNNHFIF